MTEGEQVSQKMEQIIEVLTDRVWAAVATTPSLEEACRIFKDYAIGVSALTGIVIPVPVEQESDGQGQTS